MLTGAVGATPRDFSLARLDKSQGSGWIRVIKGWGFTPAALETCRQAVAEDFDMIHGKYPYLAIDNFELQINMVQHWPTSSQTFSWKLRRALPAAELRLECRAKSVACPQPQSLITEDELKELLAPSREQVFLGFHPMNFLAVGWG